MTVQTEFAIVNYILAKNLGQGNLNPDDFNNLAALSEFEFLDYLLGEFQQYQGGRPVPKVQFGMNESVRQRLTPFIKPVVTLTADATGLALYPTDYQQMDAMYDANMNRIRYVPQHKLYSYLGSVIDPINTNPVYLIENTGFRFYPNTNYNGVAAPLARLSYVSTPVTAVYGFTLDGNGRYVFAPGPPTVDPSWYDVDMSEIIARILRKCGVNLQNQDVDRYAQEIKVQGQ